MKKTSLILLALFLAACAPAAPVIPTAPLASSPSGAAAVPPANAASTAAPVPAVTFTATLMPTATDTPAPTPTASATPFTAPVILNRYPLFLADGLGYGSALLALPGGQVWEATSGGGLRVYDSATMQVSKSLALGATGRMFARLAGDEQYVWALFYTPAEGDETAQLFRVSRADFSARAVDLPGNCGYFDCVWQYPFADEQVLWLGGYGMLWGFDRDTLEPVVQVDVTGRTKSFYPAGVLDMDRRAGELWLLMDGDPHYIVVFDRPDLLANGTKKPVFVDFSIDSNIDWIAPAGEFLWGGQPANPYSNTQQHALLVPIAETGVEMGRETGVELPEGLSVIDLPGNGQVSDGTYLWLLDESTRKLFWFDPLRREVAGVLEVYPGSEPSAADPNVIMSLSFDGQFLWTGGTEILRIALPWVSP